MIGERQASAGHLSGETISVWCLPIGFFLIVCFFWQLAINYGLIPVAFLPRPTEVLSSIGLNFDVLVSNALMTGRQALLSLLFAAALGIVVGSLIFISTLLREMLYPILITIQVLPKVALAPIFVLGLGVGEITRISFGCFLSFFPVLLATIVGLEQTDRNAVRLCQSLGASAFQTFWTVRIPFALPHIFSGLKVAATLAATGVVIGEFMTADSGLGFLIIGAAANVNSKLLFAAIFMLCFVGLGLFALVLVAQRGCRYWYVGK